MPRNIYESGPNAFLCICSLQKCICKTCTSSKAKNRPINTYQTEVLYGTHSLLVTFHHTVTPVRVAHMSTTHEVLYKVTGYLKHNENANKLAG